LHERRARGVLCLIVDGQRHAAEIAEVQVAKDHHQHQRHDEAEEQRRAITHVPAEEQPEEAEGLPHVSRISWPVRSRKTSSRFAFCCRTGFANPLPRRSSISFRGGSSATMFPSSMIATRSQRISASSR